jgi:hypothetical protein
MAQQGKTRHTGEEEMTRIALTDDSGRWFDSKKAEKIDEGTYWNGSNHISHATGSQWEHEALYRTKGGVWILNHWSQYQGTRETYKEISNEEAASWLIKNGHEPHDDCRAEFEALEIR